MMILWKLLYNLLVLPTLFLLFHIGKFFNKKIHQGIIGRKNLFVILKKKLEFSGKKNRLWFHASSLGEFEQAKPIISSIKEKYPDAEIVVTFFSPSGYENSKNYKSANVISYIPFDTPWNANQFVDIVQPTVAIILRYDIWPNIIWKLSEKKIPIFIANATMSKNSPRLLFALKQFHRKLYDSFSQILTVSSSDLHAFEQFKFSVPQLAAMGDTRFDQVKRRSIDARNKQLFSNTLIDGKKIFIVGQSWGEDEEIILPVIFKLMKQDPSLLTVIVPHEPTVEHLEQLEDDLRGNSTFIRFSEMSNYDNEQIILIDSIGILVALYKYAHVVYVGGSFRQGIHNVLEPAVFGVPVLYGPKHTNSQEAVELVKRGGGFVVEDEKSLYRHLRTFLENDERRSDAGKISKSFVEENCGATDRFLHYLEPYIKQ